MGPELSMMDAQAQISAAAGSGYPRDTFAATADSGNRAQAAAYGWYGQGGGYGRPGWRHH